VSRRLSAGGFIWSLAQLKGQRAAWALALAAVLAVLVLGWLLSQVLPLALIDFQHYAQVSRLIWHGQNPYGAVEVFAPPWLALFLAPLLPLPIKLASGIWVIIGLATIAATTLLAQRWLGAPRQAWARLGSLGFMLLTPAALFVYITGQLSALVVLAALLAGGELLRPRPRPWMMAITLAVTTFKPNIIWLPRCWLGALLAAWQPAAAHGLDQSLYHDDHLDCFRVCAGCLSTGHFNHSVAVGRAGRNGSDRQRDHGMKALVRPPTWARLAIWAVGYSAGAGGDAAGVRALTVASDAPGRHMAASRAGCRAGPGQRRGHLA